MPIRKDCFAYRTDPERCGALKDLYCAIENKPCPFYKHKIKREDVLTHVRHTTYQTAD